MQTKMTSKFRFDFLLHIFTIFSCYGGFANSSGFEGRVIGIRVPWADLNHASEVNTQMPEPAGKENDVDTFLCRAFEGDSWMAGSLVVETGKIYCKIGFQWKSENFTKFQMLDVPRGTTSWIPYNGALPDNAIIAGKWPDGYGGHQAYLCRGRMKSNLFIGNLDSKRGLCLIPLHFLGFKKYHLEVLVINAYGLFFIGNQSRALVKVLD